MGMRYLQYMVTVPADAMEDSADIRERLANAVQDKFGYAISVIPVPHPTDVHPHDKGTSYCTSIPEHSHE
jgi:hypothetical protein